MSAHGIHVAFHLEPYADGHAQTYARDVQYLVTQYGIRHLARSAATGLYDTLAHPDLIKNESPTDWHFERILPFIERALDRIAKTGVAMELNTSGVNKTIRELNPSPAILGLMRARGIPVVLGADAHRPTRVADGYAMALTTLQAAGYTEISFFLDRRRQTVPISAALASLR